MPKAARLEMRLDPADDDLIRRAAKVAGRSVSAFVLASARTEAAHVLADQTAFTLDDDAWNELDRRLTAKPRRKRALVRLAKKPKLFR